MRSGDFAARVQRGVLFAVALAGRGLEHAAAVAGAGTAALRARLALLEAENAQLRKAMALKDARMARQPARKRPHYSGHERMQILVWQAAAGVSAAVTAAMFLVTPQVIGNWRRELDTNGALVKSRRPMNKLPDYLREAVHAVSTYVPLMWRRQGARLLGLIGLDLSPTAYEQIRREKPVPAAPRPGGEPKRGGSGVVAKYENHVWHVDLTFVPLFALAAPWWPGAMWFGFPFGWWIGGVVDQYTRRAVRMEVFGRALNGADVVALLRRAAEGGAPKYLISDQGSTMQGLYRKFCEGAAIQYRYGAVGSHASIAIIERFWRTLKEEGLRRAGILPRRIEAMQSLVDDFVAWYNGHRPNQSLGGLTQDLRAAGVERRRKARVAEYVEPGGRLEQGAQLVVLPFRGRKHLPVIKLRDGA